AFADCKDPSWTSRVRGGGLRAFPAAVSTDGSYVPLPRFRPGDLPRLRRLVDRVHQLALEHAVDRAGLGLRAAEDGVDEVVVGRLRLAGDRRILHLASCPVASSRTEDLDPTAAPAVHLDAPLFERQIHPRPVTRAVPDDRDCGERAVGEAD